MIKKNPRHLIAYLKIIAVVFLWGSMFQFAKLLVADLDPISVSFMRWLIATGCLIVLYYKSNSRANFFPQLKNLPILALSGALGVCIYNILFFFAEELIPGSLVAILCSFAPAVAVILSTIFFKSRTNLFTWIGIIISLTGAITIINLTNSECKNFFCGNFLHEMSSGNLLAIGLSICTAAYSLVNRKAVTSGMSSLTLTTYSAIFGTIFLLICVMFKGDLSKIFSLGSSFWLLILYASIGANVIGYKWFNDVIYDLGVPKTIIFQNGIPLASVITGYIFFNESLPGSVFLSSLIIIIGVLLTNFSLTKYNN